MLLIVDLATRQRHRISAACWAELLKAPPEAREELGRWPSGTGVGAGGTTCLEGGPGWPSAGAGVDVGPPARTAIVGAPRSSGWTRRRRGSQRARMAMSSLMAAR